LDPIQPVLHSPRRLPHLMEGRCGSGDNFVMGHDVFDCDVLDMEAYALAKVCALEGIPFLSIKYVTDGGDHQANADWTRNLPLAASAFRRTYDSLVQADER